MRRVVERRAAGDKPLPYVSGLAPGDRGRVLALRYDGTGGPAARAPGRRRLRRLFRLVWRSVG